MHVNRIIARNRRIAGRATGHIFFVLRWPSGTFSQRCGYATSIDTAIRLFSQRLRLVPIIERDAVVAHIDAGVRMQRGGVRRVPLARWAGTKPLPEFFREARLAWKQLPKEHGDQARTVPDEIDLD
jgi:hypothetical protein